MSIARHLCRVATMRGRFAPILTAACLMNSSSTECSAQYIVPDGGTRTHVISPMGSRVDVSIAPATNRAISHNTYSSFSVPTVGANLINSGVNAGLIVNEVTSTSRSLLNGPLEIQGRQAHLVIANPNGITVDGASFLNVGGLVLSTGRVGYDGPGSNASVKVSSGTGDILVEGAGLTGTLSTLQMIAGRLKIDGPVVNEHTSPHAAIGLTAGRAELDLDPSAPPSGTQQSLVKERRSLEGSRSDEILIDVTPRGSVVASRITLATTEQGAGVRFAGRGLASVGEFTIDAGGKVSVSGAEIKAERSVKISGTAVEVLNAPQAQSRVTSTKGAVSLTATAGSIDISGVVTGADREGDDESMGGAVTLKASGDIRLLSENADRLAIAFAAKGDLVATASRSIVNDAGRLLANGTVSLAAQRLDNGVGVQGHNSDDRSKEGRLRERLPMAFRRWRGRTATVDTVDFGDVRAPKPQAFVAGSAVSINVTDLVNSGTINGLDGAVVINTARLHNIGAATGSFTYFKECRFGCRSRAFSTIGTYGGQISASRSVLIAASDSLINDHGQITAYGNLEIVSPHVRAIGEIVPDPIKRPASLYNAFGGPSTRLRFRSLGGEFNAPEGAVTIVSANPVELDGGGITAKANQSIPGGTNPAGAIDPLSSTRQHEIGLLREVAR